MIAHTFMNIVEKIIWDLIIIGHSNSSEFFEFYVKIFGISNTDVDKMLKQMRDRLLIWDHL